MRRYYFVATRCQISTVKVVEAILDCTNDHEYTMTFVFNKGCSKASLKSCSFHFAFTQDGLLRSYPTQLVELIVILE